MSHNIETQGSEAAFFGRTPAWHTLGTVATGLTLAEGIAAAHMDNWNVHLEPVMVPVGDVTDLRFIGAPNTSATVRTNPFDRTSFDVLGIVSNSYKVEQIETVAEFAQNVVDEGLTLDACGSLDGGKRFFFTFVLPSTVKVGGDDPVDMYLAIASSFDGSLATSGIVTPVRVVCQNTLTAALATATEQRFAFRHVGDGLEGRIAEARELLDVTFDAVAEWGTVADLWADTALTDAQFDRIVEGLFPVSDDAPAATITRTNDKRDALRSIYAGPTQDGIRGTAWGAFMAATEQQEWYGRSFKDPIAAAEFRMESPALVEQRVRARNVIAKVASLV